jgi:hypothetical protein
MGAALLLLCFPRFDLPLEFHRRLASGIELEGRVGILSSFIHVVGGNVQSDQYQIRIDRRHDLKRGNCLFASGLNVSGPLADLS